MKKFLMILAAASLLLFSSCGARNETEPVENPAAQQNEGTPRTPNEAISRDGETADKNSDSEGLLQAEGEPGDTAGRVPVAPGQPDGQPGIEQTDTQQSSKQPSESASQPDAAADGFPGSVGFGIVAKSDNAVSSTEKQEILDTLDGEINKLLGNIDGLDGVSEADLAIN